MNKYRQNLLKEIGITNEVINPLELDWFNISKNNVLTENFIREFSMYLKLNRISIYQKLSENIIREFKDKVYWYSIFKNQKISKEFIYEFLPNVDWFAISRSEHITDDLIIEFQKEIFWELYFVHREASFNIIKKFILKTDFEKLENFQSSHLTNEQKLIVEKMFKLKYIFTKGTKIE